MKAKVYVRLKPEVSDPQGNAIKEALATLHEGAIKSVRVGKVFDLEVNETDAKRAETKLREMAREILSNPVIEDFEIDIQNGGGERKR